MNFDRFFKLVSYAVVFCGFFSLFVSGGVGIISTILFALVLIAAWFLEGSRWQISERLGTVSIFVVVPLFYIDRKYQITGFGGNVADLAAMLAKMILVLAAIKLLQRKAERDWLFLYLMAFFEVLLAAGLSISPLYLASLILYLLVTICAIVTFEIRKTSASIDRDSNYKKIEDKERTFAKIPLAQLPMTAITLLILIIVFAAPLFFALPRVGGAGLGSNQKGLSNVTGFSDSVNLGEIGSLLQNDQIVMRARIDKTDGRNLGALHWRGVALDTFDNKRWSKSKKDFQLFVKLEKGFFLIDNPAANAALTIQSIYLEPIDTPVLFALARPVAVEGSFPSEAYKDSELYKDSEGSITFQRGDHGRLSYKVNSDRSLPDASRLKSDNENYPSEAKRYLQLPEKFDERIAALAAQITEKQANRYDKSKAIENYLQTQFGYTLEMKAGGEEPLADFLFNIREGHCEYFATAMAIMLRTQGIATRVVNGFQQGEYNETADVFVVKQKDAHSWVEVYFPRENAWIPFDPTPFAGQDGGAAQTGIVGKFNRYLEALETFWIQYFVSYDNQEQKSLMRSVKNSFVEYQAKTSVWLNEMQYRLSDWWREVRGDKGLQASARAVAFGIGYLLAAILGIILIVWLYRKIRRFDVWQRIYVWLKFRNETTIVEFYERMQKVLASKGFTRAAHQTPLEFAFALNMPEAVRITEKYNRVRFGEKKLSKVEANEIENWLNDLAENKE
jgi:transglutaminase-like putative cysteine protease